MTIEINRFFSDKNQTSGVCVVFDDSKHPLFSAVSLERGWQDNKPNISCIPKGSYKVVLEYSPRFKKDLWEIKGVPNRSECKFHSSNFWYQLNGCVSLGSRFTDINDDGYKDVTHSKNTMASFHQSLKGFKEVKLIIK